MILSHSNVVFQTNKQNKYQQTSSFHWSCQKNKCHNTKRTLSSRTLLQDLVERVVPVSAINPLTPNDLYMGRTAPLTSKFCILYIYSTNVGTEYFKHALYSPFFFLSSKCSLFDNANLFGSCIIHILYTGCAEIKKKIIPAPKG